MKVYLVSNKIRGVLWGEFHEQVMGLFDDERLAEIFASKLKKNSPGCSGVHVIPTNLIEFGSPEANEIILS